MTCADVRRRLTERPGEAASALHRHLEGCPGCERFAARLGLARQALREHQYRLEPDPGFAARVRARLAAPPDPLAWAALRLLPVGISLALCFALMLGTLGRQAANGGGATQGAEAGHDEVLAWIAELPADEGR